MAQMSLQRATADELAGYINCSCVCKSHILQLLSTGVRVDGQDGESSRESSHGYDACAMVLDNPLGGTLAAHLNYRFTLGLTFTFTFLGPQTSDNLVTSVHGSLYVGGCSLSLCSGSSCELCIFG